jgi:hypothetical protein
MTKRGFGDLLNNQALETLAEEIGEKELGITAPLQFSSGCNP